MYAKTQYSQDCLVTVCVYLRTLVLCEKAKPRNARSQTLSQRGADFFWPLPSCLMFSLSQVSNKV